MSSENDTVMTSPSPNTASAPSGSLATNEIMDGPALLPNVPVNGGDSDVDGSDDSTASLSSPVAFTCKVNRPICGAASRNSVSLMVMTKVNGLTKTPE